MTGGRASAVFGETLCLPAGRQGGTFPCLTAETKSLGSDLAVPQARLLIRLKTRRAGVRRKPHWSGRHPRLSPYPGELTAIDKSGDHYYDNIKVFAQKRRVIKV
jgi:hypothetical protein